MLLRLSTLLFISVVTGCASYVGEYQDRLIRSLPNQREVTFNESHSYPGKILCGNYTTLTADGWNTRSSDFIVGETFLFSQATPDEVFVYCSKDPAQALYSRLGIGAADGDWAPLIKLRDDMQAINDGINRYYNTANTLPKTLATLLEGDFGVSKETLIDPWGRPYYYIGGLSGRTAPQYQLGSLGADGKEGGRGVDADIRKEQIQMLDHVLKFAGY
ncbi:type II secretion system protein GspG [Congregibacter variabilis]|uniref:Type II secretion system protein GspG n=1 Tax=Congregibacter variabilis TaxID=3081200 RepID=A0ABZ0I4L8_9GAMM|nr:type II secretion system protein GspG [Congregibacter sp. IMCC43200]